MFFRLTQHRTRVRLRDATGWWGTTHPKPNTRPSLPKAGTSERGRGPTTHEINRGQGRLGGGGRLEPPQNPGWSPRGDGASAGRPPLYSIQLLPVRKTGLKVESA